MAYMVGIVVGTTHIKQKQGAGLFPQLLVIIMVAHTRIELVFPA